MPSDGAGGRSGGDGDRGSGGSSGSERGGGNEGNGNNGQGVGGHRGGGRGDGNNANGPGNSADGGRGNGSEDSNVSGSKDMSDKRSFEGGFGGYGVGNRTASRGGMAAENAVGGLAGAHARQTGETVGKYGGMGLGFASGLPGGTLAGGALGKEIGGAIGAQIGAKADRDALGWGGASSSPDGATGASSGDTETGGRGDNDAINAMVARLNQDDPAQAALATAIKKQLTPAESAATYAPTMTGEQLMAGV